MTVKKYNTQPTMLGCSSGQEIAEKLGASMKELGEFLVFIANKHNNQVWRSRMLFSYHEEKLVTESFPAWKRKKMQEAKKGSDSLAYSRAKAEKTNKSKDDDFTYKTPLPSSELEAELIKNLTIKN